MIQSISLFTTHRNVLAVFYQAPQVMFLGPRSAVSHFLSSLQGNLFFSYEPVRTHSIPGMLSASEARAKDTALSPFSCLLFTKKDNFHCIIFLFIRRGFNTCIQCIYDTSIWSRRDHILDESRGRSKPGKLERMSRFAKPLNLHLQTLGRAS